MPDILVWRKQSSPRRALRRLTSALAQGALVALPTESAYAVVACALAPDTVARAQELAGARPLDLLVSSAAAARDWLPGMGQAGQRLVRKFWPGLITLASAEGIERGLAARLSERVRGMITTEGQLHLHQPGNPLLSEILANLSVPVVCAELPVGQDQAFTARQVVDLAGDRLDLVLDDGPARRRPPSSLIEVRNGSWMLRRTGLVSEAQVREYLACMIVFVCTGNTCRSPMAEAICKVRLAERLGCSIEDLPARGYVVCSAGIAAGEGMGAAPEAIEVVRSLGVDLSGHRSQPFSAALLGADHMLVMTHSHAAALRQVLGDEMVRPRLLSPEGIDVADPIGQSRDVYEACARQMDEYICKFLARSVPGLRPRDDSPASSL